MIIIVPEDDRKVQALKEKLIEYQGRLADQRNKDPFSPPESFASWYAVRILDTLLSTGLVSTEELAQEIAQEHGGSIMRPDIFDNYCKVIEDYAHTGGKLLSKSKQLY